MRVIETTSSGYSKVELSNGQTRYRDPEGKFTKQEAFAGSKGGEKTSRDWEPVKDPETGEFTGTREKDRDIDVGVARKNRRIVVSANNDYESDDGRRFEFDFEVSSVIPASEDVESYVDDLVDSIVSDAQAEIPFVSFEFDGLNVSSDDVNVSTQPVDARTDREADGSFNLETHYSGNYQYDIEGGNIRFPR